MAARERILAGIRSRQGKPDGASAEEREAVRAHLVAHPRNAAPRDVYDPGTRFRERALALASTADDAPGIGDVPARVAAYLDAHALGRTIVCWPELAELEWERAGLTAESRGASGADLVGVTGAYCAIAETGTLMMLSGAATPPTVSLLPETHIAVIRADRVLRTMEDAWALLREEHRALPRAVSFVSGPSRTADIEQTVTLGAHGPYRVHIIVCGATGAESNNFER
jgi:L-lactate dehydrogenase complex protein LldG